MIDAQAPLIAFEEIGSTNDEARARAEAGDTGPLWISARRQSAGRGRRGRAWAAPEGNLAATYLGATQKPAAELALLGFAAALAVADIVEASGAAATLKWPNDVLIGGRKCAGILLESGAARDGRLWFALGVGINLAHAPENVAYPAAALAEFGPAPSADQALAKLRERLAHWAGHLEAEGFAPVREAWLARAHRLGAPIVAEIGGARLDGVFQGLSASGELLIQLPNGAKRAIPAGDIFFPQL